MTNEGGQLLGVNGGWHVDRRILCYVSEYHNFGELEVLVILNNF